MGGMGGVLHESIHSYMVNRKPIERKVCVVNIQLAYTIHFQKVVL